MSVVAKPEKLNVADELTESKLPGNVTIHPRADSMYQRRVIEALLFAAAEPLSITQLSECLAEGTEVLPLLEELQEHYKSRGVTLVQVAGKWAFRTAEDMSFLLRRETAEQKKLSKPALETLAIIAYHQPVTRAEIEEIRGVSVYKGTLDMLMEIGWVRMRARRRVPGRPITYGTTEEFMSHFGLADIKDLPGLSELKGAGLLDASLPPDFEVPVPANFEELAEDEEPLEDGEFPLDMHLPEKLEAADNNDDSRGE